jgi:hypothetical protein
VVRIFHVMSVECGFPRSEIIVATTRALSSCRISNGRSGELYDLIVSSADKRAAHTGSWSAAI